MAAGIILGPADINNAVGGTARQIQVILGQQVPQLNLDLAAIGAAGLQASPFNFSANDAAVIMSAIGDLERLSSIYTGLSIVTAGGTPGTGTVSAGNGYDFRTFIRQLWGLGY